MQIIIVATPEQKHQKQQKTRNLCKTITTNYLVSRPLASRSSYTLEPQHENNKNHAIYAKRKIQIFLLSRPEACRAIWNCFPKKNFLLAGFGYILWLQSTNLNSSLYNFHKFRGFRCFRCFWGWGSEILISINFEDFVVFVVKLSKLCFSLLRSILDISQVESFWPMI